MMNLKKLNMKAKLVLFMFFSIPFWNFAQGCGASMIPLSIQERVNEATKIVEATVVSSQSYWDSNRQNIYTVHTLNVYTNMRGSNATTAYAVTMGGKVDDEIQITSTAPNLMAGTTGTFFLKNFSGNLPVAGTLYELVGAAQGVIKYDKYAEQAADVFTKYTSVESDLYGRIQSATGSQFQVVQARPIVNNSNLAILATPTVSSFSPTTATAGTQTVLTINGSNFGSTEGTVSFPNSNTGGLSFVDAISSQIISWSDTQIQVQIPTTAGTGRFRVTNSTSESNESLTDLTISYNHAGINLGGIAYPSILQDDNGSGGFTFQYHTDFNTSTAKQYFEDAFDLWNCESDINFVFGSTTTTDASVDDGINIVRFDNGNELSSGVLGQVTTRFVGTCADTNRILADEIDITWNDSTNWYYGNGTPGASQYDFKSVALHELGHAHQLGHVIDDTVIMHYSLGNGESRYNLTQNDKDGAVYTMGLFKQSIGCSITPMSEQVNCCDPVTITTQPVAPDVCSSEIFTITADGTDYSSVQWQVNQGGGWFNLSDGAIYSGVTTTTLEGIADFTFDGYQYRLVFDDTCGGSYNSNAVTANIDSTPLATVTPGSAGCVGQFTFNFAADTSRTTIAFSIDGGITYPYSFSDTIVTGTASNLEEGTYNVWVRWGNGDCPQDLGDHTIALPANCVTSIPDANFEQALIDLGIDSDNTLDGNVLTTDISGITNLDLNNTDVTGTTDIIDLTGIEDFTSLVVLECRGNNLTSLDVSNNTNLEELSAGSNNNLTTLTTSNNSNLKFLFLESTKVTNIDFSLIPNLVELNLSNNSNYTAIDISGLSSLDFFTMNNCANLAFMDVRNGNNTGFIGFSAVNNPLLTCISVDDATYATNNWTDIDNTAFFSETNCVYTSIPDTNFEVRLDALGLDDISSDGQVPTEFINTITSLDVQNQSISDLTGIEDFVALETLNANTNTIASIDVSTLANLSDLRIAFNNLTIIDLSNNPLLDFINIQGNNLTALDVSNNTALTSLSFQANNITTIDISNLTLLQTLNCLNNGLTGLDVSTNTALEVVNAGSNSIPSIDFTNNPLMRVISMPNNNLTSMDVRNGNNTAITSFSLFGNGGLNCIFVDDAAYSTTNWTSIPPGVFFSDTGYCDYTQIPDANFEARLDALGYDDISGDGQVPTDLINTVTSLTATNQSISDLTGIEDFVALEVLDVANNSISSINVSNLTQLTELQIGYNNLTSIDISTNTLLETLNIRNNNLTSLDVSNNTALELLTFHVNNITTIDISNLSALHTFNAINNGLTGLDVSNNPALEVIRAGSNAVGDLDFTNNPLLRIISMPNANIQSMDLRNGSNTAITQFELLGNGGLRCISVDDAAYSTANWTAIPPNTSFSETDYCDYTAIPDIDFENELNLLGLDDILGDGQIPTVAIDTVVNLNIPNKNISNLSGIEDFASLTSLDVSDNNLTTLDLSQNVVLVELAAYNNQLTSIDLNNNTAIFEVDAFGNQLTTLNVTNCIALERLYLDNNNFTSLDLSTNTSLRRLIINDNNLENLNVRNGNNANMNFFNTTNNPNLTCILVDDVTFATNNFTNIDPQTNFSTTYCSYTQIPDANFETTLNNLGYDDIAGDGQVPTALIEVVTMLNIEFSNITDVTGIEDFTALQSFIANNNSISSIDVSSNANLETLRLITNQLTALDVSQNTNLKNLAVDDNMMESLDLSNNTLLETITLTVNSLSFVNMQNGNNANITTFNADANPDLTCILVDNLANNYGSWVLDAATSLTDTYCRYTQIPDANFETALNNLGLDDTAADGQVPTALIETVTSLSVNAANIADLTGIEDFTSLDILFAFGNSLTSIDLSNNVNLQTLIINGNNITALDLSANPNLTTLEAASNNISQLNITNNLNLVNINVDNNALTNLDFSMLTNLEDVNVANNQLTYFNIKNGNNTSISDFTALFNPSLSCIIVDDPVYSTTNWSAIDATTMFSAAACRYTAIPDANFETELGNQGYDDVSGDGQVPTALIENLTQLNINYHSIVDLTGIEDFAALQELNVSYGSLTSLDVSQNTNLTSLLCGYNSGLTTLNVSNNSNLQELQVNETSIVSLDLSQNTDLTVLVASTNAALTELNVQNRNNNNVITFVTTGTPNLTCILVDDVAYSQTNWTNIDAANNFNDTFCRYTQIPDVNFEAALETLGFDDISGDGQVPTALIEVVIELEVEFSNISDLTGIEDFTALEELYANDNSLTSLDISNNVALRIVDCNDNDIASLDVSANTALTILYAYDNTNLSSITFGNNTVLDDLDLDDCNLTTVDLSNLTALRDLDLEDNNLLSIDLSANTLLEELDVDFNNNLTTIDLSNNLALTKADIDDNPALTTVTFGPAPNLTDVYADDTAINAIDVSMLSGLLELNLSDTQISSLDVSANTQLEDMRVHDTNLTYLNVQNGNNTNFIRFELNNNPNLTCVLVDDVTYADTNFTIKDAQTSFSDTACTQYTFIPDANFEQALNDLGYDDVLGDSRVPTASINTLTSLDVSSYAIEDLTGIQDFVALTDLNASTNDLVLVDLSLNTALQTINLSANALAVLNLSALTSLTSVDVSDNELFLLNIENGNNTNLTSFDARTNSSLTCIQVDDVAYATTNFTNIDAQTSFGTNCTPYTAILDAIFENELAIYDDIPNDGQVPTQNIYLLRTLTLTNLGVADMTGLEDFVSLEELYVGSNAFTTLDVSQNRELRILRCNDNALTSLDLSNNAKLEDLNAIINLSLSTISFNPNSPIEKLQLGFCALTALDVTAMTNLKELSLSNNSLTTIDLSNNTQLELLNLSDNAFTSIDISNNLQLRSLNVRETAIVSLDLSNHLELSIVSADRNASLTTLIFGAAINLEDIYVGNTSLETLDVSMLPDLEQIDIGETLITSLDLSANTQLTTLEADNANLSFLNVKNGNNTNLTRADINGNPNLTCVLVDDVAFAQANIVNVDPQTNFSDTYCRYTAIPDMGFENALGVLGYDDISNDGQVPTALIETVTLLNIQGEPLIDLTGIQDFTALTDLYCGNSALMTIDLSNNVLLEVLSCPTSSLTSLDLSANTALKTIDLGNNDLTSLDVSNNTALEVLIVYENDLTTLDLTANTALTQLVAFENLLTDVNVSGLTNLLLLEVRGNALASLDVSTNVNLTQLFCEENNLTAVDVSNNTLLNWLYCQNNSITTLDLSQNSVIQFLNASSNALTFLNLQNGNNLGLGLFNATNNPDLSCILVDDAAYSTTNWPNIDATASYNDTYCRYTQIPNANFEAELEALGYDDISGDGQVPTALIEVVTSLTITNADITDLIGIEDFIALETLNVNQNSIASLDLSNNTALTNLFATGNNLSTLDLSNNTLLIDVRLGGNYLSSIDLSNLAALRILQAGNNFLTQVDVSDSPSLERFRLNGNRLTAVDLSNNPLLEEVRVEGNDLVSFNMQNGANTLITTFRATGNSELTCILVDDAFYSTVNWTTIDTGVSYSETSCDNNYSLAIKVYLQGAAINPNTGEEDLMRDDLRIANYIPTRSPYVDMLNCESTVFNTTGGNAIVDWIWVELRDQSDNTQILYSRSALLQRDGDVVDVDGTSPLNFNTAEDTYNIAIRHRNHLGMVTSTPIALTTTADNIIDFTNGSLTMYGSNAQTTASMPTGISGMWSGNVNGDSIIQYSGTDPDTPDLLSTVLNDPGNFLNFPTYSLTEYNVNDVNMDGIIQYSGTNPDTPFILQNVLAHPGNFLNFSTYQIIEQLPENFLTID
jgi:Leucine-rich repeat (LRR) protein